MRTYLAHTRVLENPKSGGVRTRPMQNLIVSQMLDIHARHSLNNTIRLG